MKVTVIPNLHPSAVIRNTKQWEPLFIHAFERIKEELAIHNTDDSKPAENDTLSNHTNNIIHLNDTNFESILKQLKDEGYALIDVQRYKDLYGDQIVDQGIFAVVSNGKQRKYLMLNNVRLKYYTLKRGQSPEPLMPFNALNQEVGSTCKDIVKDRYKAMPMYRDQVYYNYDFPIDDWLVLQIREILDKDPTYNIAFFDIEVHAEDGTFPDERQAKYPVSTISFIIGDEFYQLINKKLFPNLNEERIKDLIKQNGVTIDNLNIVYYDDEASMLKGFAKLLKDKQVDVLTAWNIYFDINYLANRCKVIGVDTDIFSPIGKPMYPSGKLGFHMIPGIIIADLLELYKSYEGRETRYNLDYIVEKNLGLNKVKYEGTLAELLHKDPDLYIAYSAVDTKLIQMLEDKKGDLTLHLQLKDLARISYLNSYSTLAQIDGLMYQYAKKRGMALRQRPLKADKSGAFVGAFVREPRKGYIPYVIDLDASSMYPSIMISLNISPETFVGYIEEGSNPTFMEKFLLTNEVDDETVTVIVNPNKKGFLEEQRIQIKVRDLKNKVYNNKLTISPAGTIFDRSKKGFIEEILEDLITRRKRFKKEALKLLESSNPEDKALGAKYNVIQKALKVLANAIYGAMGNQAYRFFDTRISVTITLTGQWEIKFVSGLTEKFIQHIIGTEEIYLEPELDREILREAEGEQHYVFYSDTDSSFIDIFELLVNEIPKVMQELSGLSQVTLGNEVIKLPDDFDEKLKMLVDVKHKAIKEKLETDSPIHPIVAEMFGE